MNQRGRRNIAGEMLLRDAFSVWERLKEIGALELADRDAGLDEAL